MAIAFPQPDYSNSTFVYAGVRLLSTSVDPEAITKALGVTPSRTLSGDERPSQQPGWFLSSKDSVESAELRDHIRYLTDRLLAVRKEFLDVCAAYEVEPSLFCFASNPTSVSIGLESDIIDALAALGLDYEVDLYISDPAAAGHRHVREHRQRLIDRFNSSVRRPGMYGSLQAETDIRDLAFIDRTERKLESLGAELCERGWLSPTGFRGAVERTFGDLANAESIGQAPLVEVGLKLGWLELDRSLERDEYWRLLNDSPGWLDAQQRGSGEVETEYGVPSVKIGGNRMASLGFGTNDPALPLVWFDVEGEGRITSLRRSGDTILNEFLFGCPSTFDEVAAARSVEASRNASNPFDLRHY